VDSLSRGDLLQPEARSRRLRPKINKLRESKNNE